MKKSLFKRILAVSLVALSINPGISCYADGGDKVDGSQTVEEKASGISRELGEKMALFAYELSELVYPVMPGQLRMVGCNDDIEFISEHNLKHSKDNLNIDEQINAFRTHLNQKFIEEFQSIMYDLDEICKFYPSLGENGLLKEARNIFKFAMGIAISIRQDLDIPGSDLQERVHLFSVTVYSGVMNLVKVAGQSGVSVMSL